MMMNPPHPGELLDENINALGLTIEEAALRLGVSCEELANVAKLQAAISADLALRLEMAGMSTAQCWLRMQINYDLAQAKRQLPRQVRALC
ncbi:HigA family addiction module antitoxin [Pseudaeromonas sp. ZJS20]|uniref:HigA family addiction module antitoxin n=1 Tax=Pseudaeromonas aegiceratis TaxID=3153928 RepID=UPI00390C792B